MSDSFIMSVRDGVILHAFFMEEGLGSPRVKVGGDGLPETMLADLKTRHSMKTVDRI